MKKLLTLALVSAMLLSGGLVFAQSGTVTNTAMLAYSELEVTDGIVDWGTLDPGVYVNVLDVGEDIQQIINTGDKDLGIYINGNDTDNGWLLVDNATYLVTAVNQYNQRYRYRNMIPADLSLAPVYADALTTGDNASLNLWLNSPIEGSISDAQTWDVEITGTVL